jgi:hypothetical protein
LDLANFREPNGRRSGEPFHALGWTSLILNGSIVKLGCG